MPLTSMSTALHYEQVRSRTQQKFSNFGVSVEALYLPEVNPEAVVMLRSSWLNDERDTDLEVPHATYCATIVGWPRALARETLARLRSAFRAVGIELPPGLYVLHACPTAWDGGRRFELALALVMLGAAGQISLEPLRNYDVFGAVNADGTVSSPDHSLLNAVRGTELDQRCALVPKRNALECRYGSKLQLATVAHLGDLLQQLKAGESPPLEALADLPEIRKPRVTFNELQATPTVQETVLIAALGGHSLIVRDSGCDRHEGTEAARLGQHIVGLFGEMDHELARLQMCLASLSPAGAREEDWRQYPCCSVDALDTEYHLFGSAPAHIGQLAVARDGVLLLKRAHSLRRDVLERLEQCLAQDRPVVGSPRGGKPAPYGRQLILELPTCAAGHTPDAEGRCACGTYFGPLNNIPEALLDRCALELNFGKDGVAAPAPDAARLWERRDVQDHVRELRKQQLYECNRMDSSRPNRLNAQWARYELSQLVPAHLSILNCLEETKQRWHWRPAKCDAVYAVAVTIAQWEHHRTMQLVDMQRAIALCGG